MGRLMRPTMGSLHTTLTGGDDYNGFMGNW